MEEIKELLNQILAELKSIDEEIREVREGAYYSIEDMCDKLDDVLKEIKK